MGMYKQVRTNWNRWGNQDERGTVNLLNQAHVLESFELVKTGRVYSLGAPVGKDGPVGPDRNKTWHVLNAIGNDPKPGGGGGAAGGRGRGRARDEDDDDDIIDDADADEDDGDGMGGYGGEGVVADDEY